MSFIFKYEMYLVGGQANVERVTSFPMGRRPQEMQPGGSQEMWVPGARARHERLLTLTPPPTIVHGC